MCRRSGGGGGRETCRQRDVDDREQVLLVEGEPRQEMDREDKLKRPSYHSVPFRGKTGNSSPPLPPLPPFAASRVILREIRPRDCSPCCSGSCCWDVSKANKSLGMSNPLERNSSFWNERE